MIATQPAGARLTVVKIVTHQDGLYGSGCATFTQRAEAVGVAVEKYLRPLLIGKPTDRIEDPRIPTGLLFSREKQHSVEQS